MITLSVDLVVVLLLLLLTNAMISKSSTAPAAIHTQGCVYHSCVSVVVVCVVVVVVAAEVLSCAHAIACVSVSSIIRNKFLIETHLIKLFMVLFLVNEFG